MDSSNILNQPFHQPPPSVLLDDSHGQTGGRDLTITCSVLLSIMIIFVSIRVYTKLRIMRKTTWDDRTSPHAFESSQQQAEVRRSDVSLRICSIGLVLLLVFSLTIDLR